MARDTPNPTPEEKKSAGYATSPGRSRNMAAIRRTDTEVEVAVRSLLHRRGLRFRKDYLVRLGSTKARPDIALTRVRIAVFIDGCFWHSCPEHGRKPANNTTYWDAKLEGNRERDARQTAALADDGWEVLRFWAHEDSEAVADRIEAAVAAHDCR
ncbi:very short patch repair endonuclease [Tsukamurella tyrosinosolvens]|uniref:very short patch repair endonuclease n=1 Tax=Tsukamurella tyrosinosolvens TaxID=57704 RepID=UPI000DF710B6|nr:very short patch repair endonuclease [Tsukamurella tyrosinosolvens]RDB47064.1 very short patch repair endonuclease [Tsukamurella tyrosinosolvens]